MTGFLPNRSDKPVTIKPESNDETPIKPMVLPISASVKFCISVKYLGIKVIQALSQVSSKQASTSPMRMLRYCHNSRRLKLTSD